MSSDVKIPEWANRVATDLLDEACLTELQHKQGVYSALKLDFALALLAAEQRGRKAGLEEAAKVAFDEMFEAVDAIRALKIQTAIRSLGEKI